MREVTVVTAVSLSMSDFVTETWESVRSQVGVDWEYVVAFDGEGPRHPLEDVVDDRLTVLRAGRQVGVAQARNLALSASSAPLIRNLDGDDMFSDPHALARSVAPLDDPEVLFTMTAASDLLPDGSVLAFPTFEGLIPRGYVLDNWSDEKPLPLHPTTVTVRRDVYWRVGGYRALSLGEDTALLAAVNEVGVGWSVEQPSVLYRKHPGQVTADRPASVLVPYASVREQIRNAHRGH